MFRSRSSRAQSAIVAFAAVISGAVLVLSGALDQSQSVNIDPVAEINTVVSSLAPRPEDDVMVAYLTVVDTWTRCMKRQSVLATVDVASSLCGTMPQQPDDPQLNAYLGAVLDWNKCAAPRLKRGGLDHAVIACGPQPLSPLED